MIVLALMGSAIAMWGYRSCARDSYYYGSTTQPYSGGGHGTGTRYHSYGHTSWWHSGSSSSSYGSGSSHSSGVSRGGFGSSGHAASS
jgi:hypothetical protein